MLEAVHRLPFAMHMGEDGIPGVAAEGGRLLLRLFCGLRGGFFTGPFAVDRFVLFSSRNSTGGGPYIVEEAYPLQPTKERRWSSG